MATTATSRCSRCDTGPVPTTDDDTRNRSGNPSGNPIRLALGVLVGLLAFGVAIGLVVSYLSTNALRAAGIDDADPATSTATSSATREPATPSTRSGRPGSKTDRPSDKASDKGAAKPSAKPSKPRTKNTPARAGTLSAGQTEVAAFDQVQLRGRLRGVAAGTRVQVERREAGRWARFPVTTTTGRGGSFETAVALGQPGRNVLRVRAPGTPRVTPVVTITVG